MDAASLLDNAERDQVAAQKIKAESKIKSELSDSKSFIAANRQAKQASGNGFRSKYYGESTRYDDEHARERDTAAPRNSYSEERRSGSFEGRKKSREPNEDVIVKDGSDKASANGSVRTRSRSPRGYRRGSYRERDDQRDRRSGGGDYHRRDAHVSPRDDEGDFYRPGPRDHRDNDRRYDRDPRNDRVRGRDGRDAYQARRRRSASPRPRKQKTPEPTEDERDNRTVFVQQLANGLRTKELLAFFTAVGEVVEAQIVKDRVSGRSKGVGYVEFKTEEAVKKAIELTGHKLRGIPVIVQLTEAEKNRQIRNTENNATQSNGIPYHRLYVGNIHFNVEEDDLKAVFAPFGELENVQLQREELGGRSRGYGFVQYVDPDNAKTALEGLNGFTLAGRPIRVGLGNDKFTPDSTLALLSRFGTQSKQQGSAFSGMGGRGAHAGGTVNYDRSGGRDSDRPGGGASALDDTDIVGVNFNNVSRESLMRKLARTDEQPADTKQAAAKKTPSVKKAAAVDNASRCVLLKHMFVQEDDPQKDWVAKIESEVRIECSSKYGIVCHVGVQRNSTEGEVYVKFDRVEGGKNAVQGLNGRFFDQSVITAQYVVVAVYNMIFPQASNV